MTNKSQSRVQDSKSFIFSLQHYTDENTLSKRASEILKQKNTSKNKPELQYVGVSTFDKWFSVKMIEVEFINWKNIFDMKMSMPIILSFIEFNTNFEPQSLVLCYFDGSIQYSPWKKISNYYAIQVQAGKKRTDPGNFLTILQKIERPNYVNFISDEYIEPSLAFLFQTICFVHKKGNHIYALNFKGELKILKVHENSRKMQPVRKIQFDRQVIKAIHLNNQSSQEQDRIQIAICFEGFARPFVFQISDKTTDSEIQLKFDALNQKYSHMDQSLDKGNIKLLIFDRKNNLIITCTQKNDLNIFSVEQVVFLEKQRLFISNFEKIFSIDSARQNTEQIKDISIKEGVLLIICSKSFFYYDLSEQVLSRSEQKVKDILHFGKMVSLKSDKDKPLVIVKKKFDYLDPTVKYSTTLHLFTGK